ncbi:DUF5817 domain-containing protein [Halalkaliarchaeum desulfuricum]|nr:DUF5817 domain-containing protein [Halalkaliarchaeum desulfuricum]
MYAVVGCNECGNLWLLADPDSQESATCSRCGKRHRVAKLKRFYTDEDREAARQARAALLANKRDESESFAEVAHVADLERQLEDAGVDDREYLAEAGLDPDEIQSAGENARVGAGQSSTRSREEIVRDGVERVEKPTESEVVAYASERGVPEDAARTLLERLVRRGEASESGGRYRLL